MKCAIEGHGATSHRILLKQLARNAVLPFTPEPALAALLSQCGDLVCAPCPSDGALHE